MSSRSIHGTLESALVAVGREVAFPEDVDVAPAVRRRLEAERASGGSVVLAFRRRLESTAVRRPLQRPAWQGIAATAAAIILVFGAVVGLSPTARRAVADFLGLRGVKIETVPSPSVGVSVPPIGTGLDLGERVTLAQARSRVPFEIALPHDPGLAEPDEVYVKLLPTGEPEVFLVYAARPGIPRATSTRTGLLVSEFQARVDEDILFKKLYQPGTSIEAVRVNGQPGFWMSGRPHYVLVVDPRGNVVEDQVRLAGNVLLWERGAVTLRLEAAITKEQAIRIAGSFG